MPKIKTHKIVAKRFKITKTGKVIRRSQGIRHLRSSKSKSQKRRFNEPKVLGVAQARVIKQLIRR